MTVNITPFNSNKYLQNAITSFTLKLVSSGVCVWDNLEESGLDTWQSQQAATADDETILILQFSSSSIRRFVDGIDFNAERISPQFCGYIVQATDEIRLELDEYVRGKNKSINVELWADDVMVALAELSGSIQNLLRKKQAETIAK